MALGPKGTQLQGCIAQTALGLGHQGLGPVTAVDLSPSAAVLRGFLFGLQKQLADLLLAEVGAPLDRDTLLAARGAIGSGNLQKAIGVDVEGHLHLGHAPRGRRNTGQTEAPQGLVPLGHLPLPLKHMDLDGVLVGLRGAEEIAFANRDRGIARNQNLHHPANRFKAKR